MRPGSGRVRRRSVKKSMARWFNWFGCSPGGNCKSKSSSWGDVPLRCFQQSAKRMSAAAFPALGTPAWESHPTRAAASRARKTCTRCWARLRLEPSCFFQRFLVGVGGHGVEVEIVGGDRGRAGQVGLAQDRGQADGVQERHEEEEPAQARAEGTGFEPQGAHGGAGGRLGAQGRRPFFVEAAGQAGEAFRAQEHAAGLDADGVPGSGAVALDVGDGQVALAQGDDEFANRLAHGGLAWPVRYDPEEAGALVGIVANRVAEDAQGAARVAEATCRLARRQPLDEEGTGCFVLTVTRVVGGEKEAGVVR